MASNVVERVSYIKSYIQPKNVIAFTQSCCLATVGSGPSVWFQLDTQGTQEWVRGGWVFYNFKFFINCILMAGGTV